MYQLNKYQADVLNHMASYDGDPIVTVLAPADDDDEERKKTLIEVKKEMQDLHDLGFIRDDSEDLIQISTSLSTKLGRPVKVYTISPLGRNMFKGSTNRIIQ